jgi:exopolyphosphatase / guanosine-5'-triphosphate,3'-diphosphate pyrophosphatase
LTDARPLLATIDIGTNSVLLQIARAADGGGIEVIRDRATITRLGRGVDRTRRLDPEAVARTLEVLREYATIAAAEGARVVAVGTSALRDAENAASFVEPARAILGAPIEVISGQLEAELTFLGATQGLPLDEGTRCVVDIGGGSTEIVVGRAGRVIASVSLDIGAVRLTERHALNAPASPDRLHAIDADIAQALMASPVKPCAPLVAIAGTATTLAAIHLQMATYQPKRIHGATLSRADVDALAGRLAGMSLQERVTLPGLDPARADVIVAGARILLALIDHAQATEITVSNGGVRVGLAVRELSHFRVDLARSSE